MYFITALYKKPTADSPYNYRCFGYYTTKFNATAAVMENRGDLHESLYTHMVIEKLPTGIHPSPESETWYEWDRETEVWETIDKPEWSAHRINWALG